VSQEDREAEYRGFNPFNIQIYRDRRHTYRAGNYSSIGWSSFKIKRENGEFCTRSGEGGKGGMEGWMEGKAAG
jgi:hypothetical protein